MSELHKVFMVGMVYPWNGAKRRYKVWVRASVKDGNLSIVGVVNPNRHGGCHSCGQIRETLSNLDTYGKGWDRAKIKLLNDIWKEWHLNDLNAGSPEQEKWVKENPQFKTYNDRIENMPDHIKTDATYLHNGKPYVYGSAWIKRELPDDVIGILNGFPDAETECPWNNL